MFLILFLVPQVVVFTVFAATIPTGAWASLTTVAPGTVMVLSCVHGMARGSFGMFLMMSAVDVASDVPESSTGSWVSLSFNVGLSGLYLFPTMLLKKFSFVLEVGVSLVALVGICGVW